ncbi:putative mitochondrial protein [Tanacetum coccineum]
MKAQSDSHRREVQFLVGDMVYRQRSVSKRLNEKLAPRYFGPFEVVEKIGTVAYRLKLPDTASIHPVFHVSQLKKLVGDQVAETNFPKELLGDMEMRVQPQEVLGVREGKSNSKEDREVLIRWKSLPEYESTWEPFQLIQNQFPDFHLEDKVVMLSISATVIPPSSAMRITLSNNDFLQEQFTYIIAASFNNLSYYRLTMEDEKEDEDNA